MLTLKKTIKTVEDNNSVKIAAKKLDVSYQAIYWFLNKHNKKTIKTIKVVNKDV